MVWSGHGEREAGQATRLSVMSGLFTGIGERRVKLRVTSANALLDALARLVIALDQTGTGDELSDWLTSQGNSLGGVGVCLNPLPPALEGLDSVELLLRGVSVLAMEMAEEGRLGYLNTGCEPLVRLRWIARLRLIDELVREGVVLRSGDIAFPLVSDLVDSLDATVVEIVAIQMTTARQLQDSRATSEVFERLVSMAQAGQVGTRYPEFVIDLYMRLALAFERQGEGSKAASAVMSAAEWEPSGEGKELMFAYADELG